MGAGIELPIVEYFDIKFGQWLQRQVGTMNFALLTGAQPDIHFRILAIFSILLA